MKRFNITVNGKAYDVTVQEIAGGAPVPVAAAPAAAVAPAAAPVAAAAPAPSVGAHKVESPMPGTILGIKVSAGQHVDAGQVLVVLEAMKMENDIIAPVAGTVAGIHVNNGESVDTGALLVSIA